MSTMDAFVTLSTEKVQVNKIVDEWLDLHFRKESTKTNYIKGLKVFLRAAYPNEDLELNQGVSRYLSEQRNFLADLRKVAVLMNKEKYAPSSIHEAVSVLKKFFSRHGYKIQDEDWEDFRTLLPENVTVTHDDILTKQQLAEVISYLNVHGKALFLLLASSGMRIGAAMQLKVQDLELERDPPRFHIRAQYTKRGLGGRIMWMSYETKEQIVKWLELKSSRKKAGGHGKFSTDLVFGFKKGTAYRMWYNALEKAGLDKRDPSTKTKIRIYHVHTCRKFFETQMSMAKVHPDIYEAWMGHKGYLGKAYKRYRIDELAAIYKEHMDAVTIYGASTSSDFVQKLDAAQEVIDAQNEQLSNVRALLEKYQIPNDRSLETRLIELVTKLQTRARSPITVEPESTVTRSDREKNSIVTPQEPVAKQPIKRDETITKPAKITCPLCAQVVDVKDCQGCSTQTYCKEWHQENKGKIVILPDGSFTLEA